MKLIRGIHNLSQAPQEGCVLTIGNFDGVHRGHRALLQGLQEEGRKRNLPVMVMLFEPQPLELFATDKAPARLTRLREKLRYLAECGVDYVLPFALVVDLHYMTPFISVLISYTFISLDCLAEELEDPFGTENNDLPLDAICNAIEIDLLQMNDEAEIPAKILPDRHYQLT